MKGKGSREEKLSFKSKYTLVFAKICNEADNCGETYEMRDTMLAILP